jgi:prepilin-type N-terminal cleavage/methylation domain-containing protein
MNTRDPHRRAYTLTELMVAIGIFGILGAGIATLLISSIKTYHYDIGRQLVNRDMRKFTNELSDNAVESNYFRVYRAFDDRASPVGVEESGDFALFVYTNPSNSEEIIRVVGYYRAASGTAPGPVRRFTVDCAPTVTSDPVSLAPDDSTKGDWPEVLEVSRGLSDGRLFFNFGRTIIVRGEITRRGTATKNAVNTYNFTIAPRG